MCSMLYSTKCDRRENTQNGQLLLNSIECKHSEIRSDFRTFPHVNTLKLKTDVRDQTQRKQSSTPNQSEIFANM